MNIDILTAQCRSKKTWFRADFVWLFNKMGRVYNNKMRYKIASTDLVKRLNSKERCGCKFTNSFEICCSLTNL